MTTSTGPLRIAYRGNFRHTWCTETHVARALRELGHEVLQLQEDAVTWQDCMHAGLDSDVFMWTRTWSIDSDTGRGVLRELADAGVPTVSFHLDRYIGLDREAQIEQRDPFWIASLVVTADGGHDAEFAAYGANHLWLPPAVDGVEAGWVGRKRAGVPPVVFVGTHPYPHPEWRDYRAGLIDAFRRHFGRRFDVFPKGRPVRGRQLNDLYASAQVVVGDSCLAGGIARYWSDRIPETLGRGGLLIHPNVVGLDEWYAPQRWGHGAPDLTPYRAGDPDHGEVRPSWGDLLTYDLGDYDHAVELAEWALANPADAAAIRAQGRATVRGRDTYTHRMAAVLAHVAETHDLPRHRPADMTPVAARHRSGQRATFRLAEGDTDRTAVAEVWADDTYKVTADMVRGKTVVDVGANVGAFSVLAAKLGARRVVAFEPHPDTAKVCDANIAANHVRAVVDLRRAAVVGTDVDGVLIAGAGGGAHVGTDGVRADAVHIAEVIRLTGPVGLLKVDCEGGEYGILGDAAGWLADVERLVMEWHGPGMPHLRHLDDDRQHLDRWGRMLGALAAHGRVTVVGRPMVGGLITWTRY